ncbi:MAG: sulfatase-like hydrolase/transferase [Pirellulaceae bacterium]|nr:sulfatase-like hydrolase/transferase [Planctomycetales bacterium]
MSIFFQPLVRTAHAVTNVHADRPMPTHGWLALLPLVVVSCGLLPGQVMAADDVRPNFIIINVDDLGYGDIGPYGSKTQKTPHLDRMAAEGRRLTSFYAAPVCSPSRASLMTGCYPKRCLPIPHVLFPENDIGLHPDELTIAELLRAAGYTTGIVGKWHLGDQPQWLPTRQGFDYYYGLPYSNDMGPPSDGTRTNLGTAPPPAGDLAKQQPPLPLMRNEQVLHRVLPVDQQALVSRYTDEAVSFLWQYRDEPFFLYLAHSAVHFPLYPSDRFRGTSENGLFGDWVQEVDWSVGQIMQTLRQLDIDDRTLVIFTSDNGGQTRHGANNAPLRGAKGSTWEGGVRVPTIAWWPEHIPANTSSPEIMGMFDLMPTLVKLGGGTVPNDRTIDGRDIWPQLTGDNSAPVPHDVFYYFRGLNLEAVRQGDWKLHLKDGQLYNLSNDIGESENVAGEHPQVVAQLRELARAIEGDLGMEGRGPGCRPLGKADEAFAVIARDGSVRPQLRRPDVFAPTGMMVGELSSSGAIVQVRLSDADQLVEGDLPGVAGDVRFSLTPVDGNSGGNEASPQVIPSIDAPAEADHDFIARAVLTNLQPQTRYTVRTEIRQQGGQFHPGPTATFRTLAGPAEDVAAKFVVVTGMNHAKFYGDQAIDRAEHVQQNNIELPPGYAQPDRHLGYPALDTIARLGPDFFVGTGDNVYYDSPTKGRAETVEQMRRKWHQQFVLPRYRALFSRIPTYWMIDDHDFRVDDCDNSGDYAPSVELGARTAREQLPYAAQDDLQTKTYRTRRLCRDLQIWMTENRLYRSPNKMADGPEKSIWGKEQRDWLTETLAASDATFKVLISPTPMVGPDDKRKTDNHCDIGGFRHERDEFFRWLRESGLDQGQFYIVCGDRHWQYHSVDPTGIEEFSCGALVDANARLGRNPGDPASTDPAAEIKQPYTQAEPSGGFLWIELQPNQSGKPVLVFRHHDEHGTVLYEHYKKVAN